MNSSSHPYNLKSCNKVFLEKNELCVKTHITQTKIMVLVLSLVKERSKYGEKRIIIIYQIFKKNTRDIHRKIYKKL